MQCWYYGLARIESAMQRHFGGLKVPEQEAMLSLDGQKFQPKESMRGRELAWYIRAIRGANLK